MSLHPYLTFPGSAREAMTRYQEILGGQLDIMGVEDMPDDAAADMPFTPPPGFVIHAALTFGDGDLLMASDGPDPSGTFGGFSLNISLEDEGEARRIWEAVSDGGEIQMPLGRGSGRHCSAAARTVSASVGWSTWPERWRFRREVGHLALPQP